MSSAVSRRQFFLGRARSSFPTTARVGDGCLEARGVVCRACGDACDVRAMGFLPLAGGLAIALVDPNLCTGCGECIAACPVKAISIEGAP